MKYKLITPATDMDLWLPAQQQVLLNRGIKLSDIGNYIYATSDDVSQPEALGKDKLEQGALMVARHAENEDKTIIIIDPDVDGNTSAALLLNYLYKVLPSYTKSIDFYFHTGKQHGLNDCVDYIIKNKYKFVICPDAGSNDAKECEILTINGIDVLILDHHDFDRENKYAVIINNQDGYSNYPNKALSGVGVVWQFCCYLDKLLKTSYAYYFLDLVAIGLVADMMDIRSIETKVLIQKGLCSLKNPFIYHMAQKNAFKLGSKITPIGAAFYIVPLLNAIQRSGTQEEKKLVFNSMLDYKAFNVVPSTKRGHKLGETEQLVEQAIRTCTNVKNRQTRVQDAAVAALESKIEENKLLDKCKILILLLDEDCDIPSEVRGLIANKFIAKYQRPCCILTKNREEDNRISYAGSARGCSLAGVDDFKQVCLDTGCIEYAVGHPNAFGLKIYESNLPEFVKKTNFALKDMSDEPIYYVDYIFQGQHADSQIILDIAHMDDYWGTELDEALIAIEDLKVTPEMVDIYRKKTNTIKISLQNGVSIVKFNAPEELCDKLTVSNTGYMKVDIVGKCNANEWCGNESAQILVEDLNITDSSKYYF